MAKWLEKTGGNELMEAVNLGTRGLEEALDLLEYANIPGRGTKLSEERRGPMVPISRSASRCGAWAMRWMARGRPVTSPAEDYGTLGGLGGGRYARHRSER